MARSRRIPYDISLTSLLFGKRRLWDQLFPVRCALNHQSTARSHGLVRATAISPTLINAPVAMIVPGAARPAIAAANARPIGISPNEPKKSRLTTRESRLFGTSSCSIVSQIATPKPRQKPRTTADAAASSYHGDSASTAIARLLTSQNQ